jgi:hypothetical protein
MTSYTPRNESITGANLTGVSGTPNRTYTLANDDAIAAQMQVILAENVLQAGQNYSFDSSTNTITFLSVVFDSQPITIDYFTTDGTPSLGSYCTTLQIARASGIGVEIFTENLGTGDNSETSFDLDNGNVLDGSYVLYHGASGSNSFTNLIETTHYTINKDRGTVLLTSTGVTEVGENLLYADYVYSPRHSDTLLSTYLTQVVREVDRVTGDYWGQPKTSIQYFDGYDSGYPQTDEPYGNQIENYPELTLKYSGINSITSIEFLDREGSVDRTLESTEYRIVTEDANNDYQESRLLVNTTIPNGKANVKVTFIHGYDSVPELVQELASLVGGVMALVNISGGSYKDVSTYTLGRKTFSIGQIYVNVRESIDQMKGRIDQLLTELGGNYDCV